ncbi:MAG TPA: hypothetical protein VKT77_00320, partial [Chthonomonadaceae bacterium]|nr:hypothetical protein [Chthonomonadaceae bacterium]
MVRLMLCAAMVLWSAAALAADGVPDALRIDVQLLVRLKIVRGSSYWERHAVPGQTCDGPAVCDMLGNIARVLDPKAAPSHALDTLMARKIIWNDYWEKNAVPGKQCNGEYVATLIHVGAEQLGDADIIQRYPMREGMIPLPSPSAFSLGSAAGNSEAFNTILGTQTFSPAYRFTQKPPLLETAEAIRALGSNTI